MSDELAKLRPDFAIARDLTVESPHEIIGATWTTDGEKHAVFIIIPSDATKEDRERQLDVLRERCGRSIATNDRSTLQSEPDRGEESDSWVSLK